MAEELRALTACCPNCQNTGACHAEDKCELSGATFLSIDDVVERYGDELRKRAFEIGKPPAHWKGPSRWGRHPQSPEEWDQHQDPTGAKQERAVKRLNFATDQEDPKAPPECAIVSRWDLMIALGELTHKRAAFEHFVTKRLSPASDGLRRQVARSLVEVTNRWIKPNFPEGHELRPFDDLCDQEQRLNLDFADAVIALIREGLALRLNDALCEMKPGWDDSMVGFNEAWDIVRRYLDKVRP